MRGALVSVGGAKARERRKRGRKRGRESERAKEKARERERQRGGRNSVDREREIEGCTENDRGDMGDEEIFEEHCRQRWEGGREKDKTSD